MTETPFMPKATAVWLVENTTLTFKQIAEFCNLHELEIKGIADGDVAKGIKAYNPILAGQLSREEIELCSKDTEKKLRLLKKIEKGKIRISNVIDPKIIGGFIINFKGLQYDASIKNQFKLLKSQIVT